MENMSIIEENKEQKTENKALALLDISSHFGLFFLLYLIFVAVTIGWSYLFCFDTSVLDIKEIGLFGAACEQYYKEEPSRKFFCEIFEEYNNFRYLFQVVTLFYFLPFLVSSVILCFVRTKKWRLSIGALFGLIIIGIQMQFGYLCYDAFHFGTVWQHILLFGGFSVLLAVTYGLILNYLYKEFVKSEQISDKLKALFFAHLLAYLALSMILVSYWFSVFGIIAMVLLFSVIFFIILLIAGLAIIINKITHRKGKTS